MKRDDHPHRCTATSKRSGERCRSYARTGFPVCRIHGAGGDLAQMGGRIGRPLIHGRYAWHLHQPDLETYAEAFGDLSPFAAVALAQTVLARMVESYYKRLESEWSEGGSEVMKALPAATAEGTTGENGNAGALQNAIGRLSANGKRSQARMMTEVELIGQCERVVRMITAAHAQLAGKRILLSFDDPDVEAEVRRQIDAFVRDLVGWLPSLLCPTCRRRVAEELDSGRQTQIVPAGW